MTASDSMLRPNCQEILNEINLWSFGLTESMNENNIKIIDENIKIEECFHLYFIQTELRNENKYKESKILDKCIIS